MISICTLLFSANESVYCQSSAELQASEIVTTNTTYTIFFIILIHFWRSEIITPGTGIRRIRRKPDHQGNEMRRFSQQKKAPTFVEAYILLLNWLLLKFHHIQ